MPFSLVKDIFWHKPKTLFRCLKEFGLKSTLKIALSYLGVRIYFTIKYPFSGIKATVRSNLFWKNLEKGYWWESNSYKYISNVVKEGQIILDMGACYGSYTLLFSKLVRDGGHVYAFEPDPKAFDILCDNIEKNHLTNAHIDKICISNSVGEAKLRAGRFGTGASSMIGDEPGTALRETIVETTTIDKYCEENRICPDGIKMDIEGAEGLAIDGCRNIIKKCSPWILLEFHGFLMSEEERRTNWHKIVDSAQKVVFLDGDSKSYHYGSEVKSMPDCLHFHVFIEY